MAISKHDKQALAQLFIDMGVPLVVAMQTVESWADDQKPQSKRAEELAKLLNMAVECATKITKKLGIRDSYTLENVRGKIIRIVTPIIGEYYVANGSIPQSDQINGLTDLFDVLLSFSDAVSPTEDDKNQSDQMVHLVDALNPVIAALRELSNSADKDNLSSIAKNLVGRANGLADDLGVEDIYASGLLKSVAAVFVSCFKAEKGEDMDAIWAECDFRLTLIRGLTGFVGKNIGLEPTIKKPMQKPLDNTEIKGDIKPVKENKKNAAVAESNDTDDDDEDFNPMAFFSAGGK